MTQQQTSDRDGRMSTAPHLLPDASAPSTLAYLPRTVRRVAMLSVHTSPLARIGGPSAGGMNVYVRELARELARRGAQVDIFTRLTVADEDRVAVAGPGVNVIALPCGPFGAQDKNALAAYLPEFATAVAAWARENGRVYDLIHAHYWLSGIVGQALRCRWDIPLLMTFHTTAQAKNGAARTEAERETTARLLAEQRLVRQVDATLAFNPQEKADLTWFYGAEPGKVCIVPAGIDTTLFTPGNREAARQEVGMPSDASNILFVGRIDPIKGIDVLVDALSGLRTALWQTAPPHLWVIGGGTNDPGMPALIARAQSLRVLDAITFVGSVPHPDLLPWYRAADVVAVPSFYESFGLVAVEAMASGTPVVASRAGGLAFTVSDDFSGVLVPPNDPPALTDALGRVLADCALRERLGAGAVQTAAPFGWPAITDRLVHIYDRLMRGYRLDLCGSAPTVIGASAGGD